MNTDIIKSQKADFKPAPWCVNGHVHTICASLFFKPAEVDFERKKIDTPDGDFLNIDCIHTQRDNPVLILLHGLEGSSGRYYIQNLAHQMSYMGFNVVALNFRSCGGEMNKTRRFYHSGEFKDLKTVCRWIQQHYPDSLQIAAGFSLGGSVLLNYLNEFGDASLISAFAAVSVPYDLYRGSINLQKGFNRLYDYQFLVTLREKLQRKKELYDDLPDFHGSTLFDFDDQVTAPVHGFKDAEDYYTQCSSAFFLDSISKPGLLIHSMEDPLCPFDYIPMASIDQNPNLTACFTRRGGHVGYWSMPPGWIERTISQYFNHILGRPQNAISVNDINQ
ncbi:MAG TPA: alpha/beta fold hydrolase [Balneolaceae bacterium]|nr:alpha/beta fold hydrolase [Balneolaceae bacterium]